MRAIFSHRTCWLVALFLPVILAASMASAQQIWVGNGWWGRTPPKWAKASDFDGSFVFCRGFYTSVRNMQNGNGWNTDYPGADHNFSVRLAELTRVRVKFATNRQPNHVVIALTDPLLFRCPILFMTDIGSAQFSDEEVLRLREYFLKGGFVWVDDSWGFHTDLVLSISSGSVCFGQPNVRLQPRRLHDRARRRRLQADVGRLVMGPPRLGTFTPALSEQRVRQWTG